MPIKKFVDHTSTGGKVSSTEPGEGEEVKVQHVPFKVEYEGPAEVGSKFTEKSVPSSENSEVLINQFRGRPLQGQKLNLPENFEGVIASDLRSSALGGSESEGNSVSLLKTFDSFTYWNWDRAPSGMDKQNKLLDWLELSKILHEPVKSSVAE